MNLTKSLSLTFLLLSGMATASAASFIEGKISYTILSESDKTVAVAASAQKYSGQIAIPEKVTHEGTEYTVTAISKSAFAKCVSMVSVNMPATLTSVGEFAFDGCAALTTLEFPANITTMGQYALQGCNNLSNLALPEKLKAIPVGMLVSCEALESLTVPSAVTAVGDWAFNYATGLQSVVLPDGLKTLGEGAFAGCSSMSSVKLGKSLESIGPNTFLECSELTSIDLPATLQTIGFNAFSKCIKLAAINVEEGNKYMASYHGAIFTSDLKTLQFTPPAIKEVVVPDECTKIGAYAMSYSGVERVTGCKNLLVIEEYAMTGCKSLNYVELGNKLTTLGDDAFSSTAIEYITLPESLTSMGNRVFENCGELKAIVIPDQVKEIGNYNFFNCMSLQSATWGKGVTSMGEYAFRHCPNLTTMVCKPVNPVAIYDDTYFDADQYTTIHVYVPAASLNAYKSAKNWNRFANISAITESSITLATGDVTATSATVTGHPSDDTIYWYTGVETLAKYDAETIWSTLLSQWKAEGGDWYAAYCEKAHKGDASQTFNNLTPNTMYACYAFAVDSEGKLVIPVTTATFLTANDVKSLAINVGNISGTSAQITVTPTDDETPWYATVVARADFKGEKAWSELVDAWKAEGENWFAGYTDKAHKGEFTQTFSDLKENTEYVAFAFAVDNSGAILMPQVSEEFNTKTLGIEAVESEAVAVNVNGNVISISGNNTASIYTVDGRLVAVCGENGQEVAPGIYLVQIQGATGKTVKIIVK